MNYHTNLVASPANNKIAGDRTSVKRSYVVKRNLLYFLFKRVLDIIFSLLFLSLIMSWLFPIVSLLIIINSKGPVFFIQKRVGKNGKTFSCIKFRTMILNDESDEKQAEEDDYRITSVGKVLRQTNIDEFPQFINVLLGHMSLIGPRPHMVTDCIKFSFVVPEYHFRSIVKPGITGLAQIKGYHGPVKDYESITARYKWDAEYVRNAGLSLDIKILFLTIFQSLGNIVVMITSKN